MYVMEALCFACLLNDTMEVWFKVMAVGQSLYEAG